MAQWDNGGGFSLDASERIEANDRRLLEHLLRTVAVRVHGLAPAGA